MHPLTGETQKAMLLFLMLRVSLRWLLWVPILGTLALLMLRTRSLPTLSEWAKQDLGWTV